MAISKVPVVAGTKTLTRGSIVAGNASGEPAALAIGSNNQVLKSDGTDAVWGTDASGTITAFTNGVDNRVVTASSATALNGEEFLTYNGTILGVGADGNNADLGQGIHIKSADSGGSVETWADELVIEGGGAGTGMTFLSNNDQSQSINFGDAQDSNAGMIQYSQNSNLMVTHVNGAERMRITSDGNVQIGTTANNGRISINSPSNERIAYLLNTNNSSMSNTVVLSGCARNTANGSYLLFEGENGGGSRFFVADSGNVTNTNNSYGQSSDERIKKDITNANSQWDDIKALKVKNFKYKHDDSITQLGVVAQDLETSGMNGLVHEQKPTVQEVESNSVFGTLEDDLGKPILNENGEETGTYKQQVKEIKEKVKSVKYSVLYMKAIKALQESMERIEQLEAKVTALENA